jgi:inward rectifier potassium channel
MPFIEHLRTVRELERLYSKSVADASLPRAGIDAARTLAPGEDTRDLGFGRRVAEQTRTRFLNRDGSFNVRRAGLPFLRSLSAYHALLTISWPRFFLLSALAYFVTNILFAGAYLLCGPGALAGSKATGLAGRFAEAFFFSVQTLATIGYGVLSPNGLIPNMLSALEALFGLMGFALITGILFSRFSRPTPHIVFSEKAVVAPFREGQALMFRIANERSNQLTDLQAKVTLSRMEGPPGAQVRRFHLLNLDRPQVLFFPLHWVVVHPIDEQSPLRGVSAEEFQAADSEILILISAMDETFFQTVHVRSSYKPDEVAWGMKFADMFLRTEDGLVGIDMRRIHDLEPLS